VSGLIPNFYLDTEALREEQERKRREMEALQQQQQQPPMPNFAMLAGPQQGTPGFNPDANAQGDSPNLMSMIQQGGKAAEMFGGDSAIGQAGGYVAPALAMYKFVDFAHDKGLIDKNTEVLQDSTQWIKQPFRWATDVGGNALSKLKFW